ncbi:MAG: serine hydrolase domain-containing protein [Bacteroidales bacterium]
MFKRYILIPVLFLFFLLFELTFGYSGRMDHAELSPPDISFSPLDITNDLSGYHAYDNLDVSIDRFIKQWGVKGASVAVAKHGKLLYAKGFGFANEEEEENMQPYHLLRIASVSKLITAVAVMNLIEDGKLDLNDKVFGIKGILNAPQYLEYIDSRVEDITVMQLLNHSGGWTSRWGDHLFMPGSIARQLGTELPIARNDIISFALAKRLHFTPGLRSSYSNLGYLILESVIEKVSGRPYEKYVQSNVFRPLGINDAFLAYNFDDMRYPLEVRYYEVPDASKVPAYDGKPELVYKSRGGNDIRTLGAAGGWVISSVSLMKFLSGIDMYSESTIISKRSIRTLESTKPGMQPLGWRRVAADGTKWRTGSFSGTSALTIMRSDGLTYVFITNTSPWVGARFPYEVNRMMTRALSTVNEWPNINLFSIPSFTNNNYVEIKSELKESSDNTGNLDWSIPSITNEG